MRRTPAPRRPRTGAPDGAPASGSRLARAALAAYPPAWRARYGEETLGYLDESGVSVREVASLLWRVVPAWIWPPAHPGQYREGQGKRRGLPGPLTRVAAGRLTATLAG